MVVVAMDEGEAHGYGHGWLGKMKLGFGDVLTMSWGSSIYSSSDRNALWWEIDVGLAPWLEEEDGAWGSISSNSGDVEGVGELQQLVAGMHQQQGTSLSFIFSFSSSPFFLSFSPFFPSLVSWFT